MSWGKGGGAVEGVSDGVWDRETEEAGGDLCRASELRWGGDADFREVMSLLLIPFRKWVLTRVLFWL